MRRRLLRLAARPHLPRRTVRLRLTVLYSGLFLVLGAALLAFTYVLVQQSTGGTFTFTGPHVSGAIVGAPLRAPTKRQPAVVAVAGGTAARAPLATPNELRARAHRLQALIDQQRADELNQLLTQSGIALAIMTVVSVALGWLVAGRVLRPLRTITAAARNISATNLHERLALRGPNDELMELGDTVDELLARLENSFEAQRAFVANASHELRTPLARQRTVGQVALADPDATIESLRAALERILATGKQQERLIEALLTLTRGQAGPARRDPVDLAGIAAGVLDARHPEAGQRQLRVEAVLRPATTTGDLRLLERLVTNLTDNALGHNRPAGRVDITTGSDDAHAFLRITNDGPTIPPTELERLFLPLQRLETDRSSHPDGLGLGLSIVDAVACAHDATILTRARPEGGLDIEVRFPRVVATRVESQRVRPLGAAAPELTAPATTARPPART